MPSEEKRGKRGSPPKEHQFKRGQSGNPKGRPPGSSNRNAVIRKVLGQVVSARLGGETKKISVTEASLRRLAQSALEGDRKAIGDVLRLWKESEDAAQAEMDARYPFSDADRQVIEQVYARMKKCEEPSTS